MQTFKAPIELQEGLLDSAFGQLVYIERGLIENPEYGKQLRFFFTRACVIEGKVNEQSRID